MRTTTTTMEITTTNRALQLQLAGILLYRQFVGQRVLH
jgi:hypothetical protein